MKRYQPTEIDELAQILKNDGVICIPTDTVWGMCARINSEQAREKLAKIKRRPVSKSFPVMCLDEEQARSIAIVDENAAKLMRALMPGPVTLVLRKRPEVLAYVNNAGEGMSDELAIRMAPAGVLKELLRKTGSPIFLTSANVSGDEVCKTLDEIEELFPELDGALEGEAAGGEPSTIVDCTNREIKIQRPGPISREEIIAILRA